MGVEARGRFDVVEGSAKSLRAGHQNTMPRLPTEGVDSRGMDR